MTPGRRKRLVDAARELAMECVAGTAPDFGAGVEFHRDGSPGCALGHVMARAGLRPEEGRLYAFSDLVSYEPCRSQPLVTTANDTAPDALPWALLSLADELEAR